MDGLLVLMFVLLVALQVATLLLLRRLLRSDRPLPGRLVIDEADGNPLGRHKHKYPPELAIPDPEHGVTIMVCRCGARTPRRMGT